MYYYNQPGHYSGLAIASMVLGIVWIYWIGSLLAIIFGHIAISQARKDSRRDAGKFTPGVVIARASSGPAPGKAGRTAGSGR